MQNDSSSLPPLINPPTPPRGKFFGGFFGWLFSARLWRALLFLGICLVTLVGLFYAVENWRGARALDKLRTELATKGEKVDWREIIPPPIPDDRNLAMAPLFKPLLDYERVNKKVEWPTSDDRAKAFQMLGKGKPPKTPGIESDGMINLKSWQKYFQGNMNFPQPAQAGSPAVDVLVALGQFDPQFKELQEAVATRPESRWPVKYEENFGALIPHLAVLKSMVLALELRAAAHLELGQTAEALEDIKIGLRLANSLSTDPILITHLVRMAMDAIIIQPVREGLARHQWTDPQLAQLQSIFAAINLLAEFKRAMRGERSFCVEAIEMVRTHRVGPELFSDPSNGGSSWASSPMMAWAPRGWFFQNECSILRFHNEYTLTLVDENALRIMAPASTRSGSTEPLEAVLGHRATPYNVLAWTLVPAISSVLPKTGRAQTQAEATGVACAIERYRLSHGQYPEKLEQLVPAFLPQPPRDIMDGELLRYQKDKEGGYILYSIGWNQTDDGGVPGMTKANSPIDQTTGDWVWRLPKVTGKAVEPGDQP